MKDSFLNTLPRWLLTALVCAALAAELGELLLLDLRWWIAAPALLLWCAALFAAEHYGRFWMTPALWAAAFGLCLLLSDRAELAGAALAALSRTGAAGGYGELCLLLLTAAATVPLAIILRFYWTRLALSLGWTALLVTASLLEWSVPRIVPAALTPLLLLTLAETVGRLCHDPEPGTAPKRALLMSLLPAVLLLALLPAPAEPYDYPMLQNLAEAVEQLRYDMETALRYRRRGERQFDVSFKGVSDEAGLGGTSGKCGPGIVYAWPQTASDEAVYLFGNAWDHFDGHGWSSTLKPETTELLNCRLDTAEHVYALWRLLSAEDVDAGFDDYFRSNSVYLSYYNMNVRTMFQVMNMTHIETDEDRFPYSDAPTGSMFDYVQQNETWYSVSYLEPNSRTLDVLIAASEGTAYNEDAGGPFWFNVASDLRGGFHLDLWGDINMEKTLAARARLINTAYLDAGDVSDRARALAAEITAGCEGDYDKLSAIAAYLRENYSYEFSSEEPPENENFLDWLLFKEREGYCAWYATAATLLARSVGIPARYVQGYRGELAGEMFTKLGADNAHAWCEGYIKGYGWVTVEATPGFSCGSDSWLTAAELDEADVDGTDAEAVPNDAVPDHEETGEEPQTPEVHPGAADEPESEPVPIQEPEPEPDRKTVPTERRRLPALIPVVLFAVLLTVPLMIRASRRRRYVKADCATKLRLDLERLLRDLRGIGYPRRSEESLRQYFARLPWYFPEDEAEAKEMVALYERTFFALIQPSEAELERHRTFAAHCTPKTGWQRFWQDKW